MSFFTEMQDLAAEFLGPGDESFGEAAVARRPGTAVNEATRAAATGDELTMHMRGTFESSLSSSSSPEGLAGRYERIFIGYPALESGDTAFEPTAGDKIDGDGTTWEVKETAPERRQGLTILYTIGLVRG
jgi:hypothetical protein